MNVPPRLLRWTLPACLLLAVSAPGQDAPVPGTQSGINPESMFGKESAQGVYVRDSAVALEKFAQAQHMERLKEWAKAADLYQEVLEKFADRVVPSQVDKDNNIYQYTSVIAAVQEKMSHWPADGLEVYRSRFESTAQSTLDNAEPDDRAALQAILSKYFATDTAKTAGIRLMDLYFEAGEFSAAAWLGELLLNQHPNLLVERPRVMYRCALANHMAGDDKKANAILADLTAKYPQETATIAGVDQKLADSLATELAIPAPHAQAVADSSWPMFGGSPSHARLSTAAGRPGAPIAQIELTKPNFKTMQADQATQMKQRDRQDQDSGATIGVMPVVDHGDMFFQDGVKLYAVNIESGEPLPGWAQTWSGDRHGAYTLGSVRIPPRAQLQTVTLTDNAVLAVMGQTDRFAQIYGATPGEGKIVCLNRADGTEKWTKQSKDLPDEAQNLRGAEFTGSPLVVDGSVYVIARSTKGAQFEDCYVICFDVETGKYKWNCYIASANSIANAMMDGDVQPLSDTTAQLAYASGRLYVLTNLGALAAVDAYGGRIVWLSIYQRDQSATQGMNPMMPQRFGNIATSGSSKPWMSNPVFVDAGKVFVLPSDGKYLEIYDAGTGIELKRLNPKHLAPAPAPNQPADTANALIAINGSRLLVTGNKSVAYVDWEKYNIDTFDRKRDPSIVWPRIFPSSIRGRAFVANDRVFFPTTDRMLIMALKGWRVIEDFPSSAKSGKGWDTNDGGNGAGNIVVSDDDVIVAGNRRIDVYTNLDAAKQKVEAEIAANPTSPAPRLKYAERMFAAGDLQTAIQKLDEAIDLIGGRDKMTPGLAREAVYNDAMTFADKAGHAIKDQTGSTLPIVQALYDRAGAAALSPLQQVSYRMMRGKLDTITHDEPSAVKLYQQIITDPEWRKVAVMDDVTNSQTQASAFARRAIDNLIHTAGPICYAAFEQEAIQQFAAAKASNQVDAMVNVATVYPNAKVAAPALLAASDLKDAGGDHRGAVQLLRQLYLTYPNADEKQRILESLARNYLGIPNRSSVAIARLNEAVKLGDANLSQPLPLPDGRMLSNVSLAQALDELKKASGQAIAKSLPDFNLPIPNFIRTPEGRKKYREPFAAQPADAVIANVQSLVVPARDYQRNDRLATFTPGTGLAIYAPGSVSPLMKVPMGASPGLAWTPTGPIAWSVLQATQFRGDSTEAVWSFDVKAVPAVEVAAAVGGDDDPSNDTKTDNDQPGPQGDGAMQGINARIIMNGNRRIFIQNGVPRVIDLQPVNNGPVITAPGGGEAIVDVRPTGDSVLITTSTGRIVALDSMDGHLRWQTRVGDRPAERMLANEDFLAIMQRDDSNGVVTLTVLDTYSGQTIGRRTFDGSVQMPVNMALAPDGTLVYSMPDRIVLKNLYAPWSDAEREIIDQKAVNTGQFPYVNAMLPDQLQVVDGRVLALSDQNMTLRVFSMETGKPMRYTPVDSNKEIDLILQTGNKQAGTPVIVRVVGSQVYLVGQQSLISYNLDHPDQSWRLTQADTVKDRTADVFIGKKHIVVLTDTTKRAPGGKTAAFHLRAHARYGTTDNDPAESGYTDYNYEVADPTGIIGVQAVEGGFYYLSGDQKLHFLKGLGS